MPRKSAADLVLGGRRVGESRADLPGGRLHWHYTELGRRTDDETFHIIRRGDGWALLDADWNDLEVCRTIPEAQQIAERVARGAAR